MSEEELRIERGELFSPEVDQALAREHAGRERIVADLRPVSPIRRVLLNGLVYLPLAAALAALASWLVFNPAAESHERRLARGAVLLINAEPFDGAPGAVALTIGGTEVLVTPDVVRLESGAEGEPPIVSLDRVRIGDRIEVAGQYFESKLVALAIRPTSRPDDEAPERAASVWGGVMLPLCGAMIAFALLLAEGLTTRNWIRMVERTLLGSLLATIFAFLAQIPVAVVLWLSSRVFEQEVLESAGRWVTIRDVSGVAFVLLTVGRSVAWAMVGAGAGLGMNLARATSAQLRNSVIGGAIGGALGGLFFDPIDRWLGDSIFQGGAVSRLVGLVAVGLCIGVFVALVDRLARDAWLRVRTGPLAGKSFVLYKTPTIIGNAPRSDVYLYKDAEIDPSHAAIHRVGAAYELEDLGSRMGTSVSGARVRRRRLVSGDQIIIGSTILDFEERQRRTPAA